MKSAFNLCLLMLFTMYLVGCNQAHEKPEHQAELKNGENIIRFKNDSISSIFYVQNNKKNGAALELNEDGTIKSIGTFKNDLRDGLWLESKNGTPIENYFSNGILKISFKDKFFFDLYRDTAWGYTFLVPYNWDTTIAAKGVIKFGFSKKNKSTPPPNFSISFLGKTDKNPMEIVNGQIKDLSSLSNFEIIYNQENTIIYKASVKNLTAYSFNKVIKSKSKVLLLSCTCNEESYNLYSLLFTTMLISFNTIN